MFLRGCMTFRAKATSSRQSVWIYSVTHCFMLRRVSRSESSPTRFIEAAITSSSLIATAFSHAACSASSLARCLASHSAFRLASACSCSCRLRSSSPFYLLSDWKVKGNHLRFAASGRAEPSPAPPQPAAGRLPVWTPTLRPFLNILP